MIVTWFHPLDSNVEDDKVEEVIRLISSHAEKGFREGNVEEILAEIRAMEHEDERLWELNFVYLDRTQKVKIYIFKDDPTGADFSVQTTDPVLEKKIRGLPPA